MGVNPNLCTTYPKVVSVDGTVVNINTEPCTLAFLLVTNNDTANRFLQIFNKLASNVILGVTPPTFVLHVQGNGTAVYDLPNGLDLSPAFSIVCTTTPTGAVAVTNAAYVSILYY